MSDEFEVPPKEVMKPWDAVSNIIVKAGTELQTAKKMYSLDSAGIDILVYVKRDGKTWGARLNDIIGKMVGGRDHIDFLKLDWQPYKDKEEN